MGKKMAGTNEFAFFRCRSTCTGGGPESGRKKFEKMPSGRYRYKNVLFQCNAFERDCEEEFGADPQNPNRIAPKTVPNEV